MLITIVPLISCIISLAFAITVLDQYLVKRRPYQLVWTIGLLMFSISTGSEFLAAIGSINAVVYKSWYLFGAIYVAAYLGMGTIYLLARRRVANTVIWVLGTASVVALALIIIAPVDWSAVDASALSGDGLPTYVRLLTPFFNTFGTIALVGGAAWSAWQMWRHHVLPHRVVSNLLIAGGALLTAAGGALNRFNIPEPTYFSELLGIIVIFAGFLRSREVFGLFRVPVIHWFQQKPPKPA